MRASSFVWHSNPHALWRITWGRKCKQRGTGFFNQPCSRDKTWRARRRAKQIKQIDRDLVQQQKNVPPNRTTTKRKEKMREGRRNGNKSPIRSFYQMLPEVRIHGRYNFDSMYVCKNKVHFRWSRQVPFISVGNRPRSSMYGRPDRELNKDAAADPSNAG